MRWIAAAGWAGIGAWLVLFQSSDSRDLSIGVFCLVLAALIAIGRQVGRVAATYGTGAAVLVAVGSLLLGAVVITLPMAMLAGVSYRAASSKPITN